MPTITHTSPSVQIAVSGATSKEAIYLVSTTAPTTGYDTPEPSTGYRTAAAATGRESTVATWYATTAPTTGYDTLEVDIVS